MIKYVNYKNDITYIKCSTFSCYNWDWKYKMDTGATKIGIKVSVEHVKSSRFNIEFQLEPS